MSVETSHRGKNEPNAKKARMDVDTTDENSNMPIQKSANITNLSDKILLKIFRHLSTEEVVHGISRVCRKFNQLSKDSIREIKFDFNKSVYVGKILTIKKKYHHELMHLNENRDVSLYLPDKKNFVNWRQILKEIDVEEDKIAGKKAILIKLIEKILEKT